MRYGTPLAYRRSSAAARQDVIRRRDPNSGRSRMANGLYISAQGAYAQSRRLEMVANNMANVDTVGFKRELAVFQAPLYEAVGPEPQAGGAGEDLGGDLGGGVIFRQTTTDFSSGPLKNTGGRTDMAVKGEGFFVVRKNGEDLLTRAGNFRMTSRGELVTQHGDPVLSDAGAPIAVNPDDPSWKVTDAGGIQQQGVVQNLAIVKPNSLGDLVKAGENLFRPLADGQPIAPADRRIAPGYLEMSTVQPVIEMTELIQASRLLEANVNMMKTQDEMQRELVNRVMAT